MLSSPAAVCNPVGRTPRTVYNNFIQNGSNTLRRRWHNSYCCRKWTWWLLFKFWVRRFVFHFSLMPLGKVWIHIFAQAIGKLSGGWEKKIRIHAFRLATTHSPEEGKILLQTAVLRLKKTCAAFYRWWRGCVNTSMISCILLEIVVFYKVFILNMSWWLQREKI